MKYALAIFMVFVGLIVAGCSQSSSSDQAAMEDKGESASEDGAAMEKTEDSSGSTVKESIKSLFSKGMGLKCTYKAQVADDEGKMIDATAVYYVKGNKANIEYTANGETWNMIVNETAVAMGGDSPSMSAQESDCDWIVFSTEQQETNTPNLDEDLSVEEYNAETHEGYVDFKCEPSVVDDKMFTVSGKTCDFASMMTEALGDIDMSEYQ